jgi:hypothetical protein
MRKKAKSIGPRVAYSVAEFAVAYRISRTEVYRLWRRGDGPRRTRVAGRRIVITVKDAEDWAAARQVHL